MYDAFGTINPVVDMMIKTGFPPQVAEQWTNFFLSLADFRYRLYLDWLVSVRDTPKGNWPKPPW